VRNPIAALDRFDFLDIHLHPLLLTNRLKTPKQKGRIFLKIQKNERKKVRLRQ
jgi:hypothetical protein